MYWRSMNALRKQSNEVEKNQMIAVRVWQSQMYAFSGRFGRTVCAPRVLVCALTLVFIVMIFFDLECAPYTQQHNFVGRDKRNTQQPKCHRAMPLGWSHVCACIFDFDSITSTCRSERAPRSRVRFCGHTVMFWRNTKKASETKNGLYFRPA